VSTTVDEGVLAEARVANPGRNDAALFDAALVALLARTSPLAIDAAYSAYDEHPFDEPDEWGDLSSFRAAAAASWVRYRCGEKFGGVSLLRFVVVRLSFFPEILRSRICGERWLLRAQQLKRNWDLRCFLFVQTVSQGADPGHMEALRLMILSTSSRR
jgi:hypothetical protein